MKWLITSLLTFTPMFVSSSPLIDEYKMPTDNYLFNLTYRCLNHHVINKSNAIDTQTSLPVTFIAEVNYSSAFTLSTEVINFSSKYGKFDEGANMRCIFSRETGDLLVASSNNSNHPNEDYLGNDNSLNILRSSYKYNNNDDDLLFGIKLKYEEFIDRVSKLTEIEKSKLISKKTEDNNKHP